MTYEEGKAVPYTDDLEYLTSIWRCKDVASRKRVDREITEI